MHVTHLIQDEEEYRQKLARISFLMDHIPDPDSPEHDELDLLALLVQDYESMHYPLEPPHPIDVMTHAMEARGYTLARLAQDTRIGAAHLSEVLHKERALSLNQIRSISRVLDISVESLIAEYELDEAPVEASVEDVQTHD